MLALVAESPLAGTLACLIMLALVAAVVALVWYDVALASERYYPTWDHASHAYQGSTVSSCHARPIPGMSPGFRTPDSVHAP